MTTKTTKTTTIKKTPETTIIIGQYSAETKYDSYMFRVVKWEYANNNIRKYLKDYKDNKYIYLKKKAMLLKNTELEKNTYYSLKIQFAQFVNKELDLIKYIKKVSRIKEVDYTEYTELSDSEDNSQ